MPLSRKVMTVWEALDFLNTLVDDSDPDVDFTQIEHAMQTAEAIRAANQPRWFIVTGLVHDLGKILCLFGEPQWAVVGDTFPVGCGWSPKIVYSDLFRDNPDAHVAEYQTADTASTSRAAGSTTSTCRGVTTSTSTTSSRIICRRSALHAALPLVLSLAQGEGEYTLPHERDGPRACCSGCARSTATTCTRRERRGLTSPELMPYYAELVQEFFPEPLHW